jgi:anti-sigma regulatory factor (Ser/Thr protein kinase)
MLKWLAEHPLCVIVNLAGIEVRNEIPLWMLPAVARRADAAPIFIVVDRHSRSGQVIENSLGHRMAVFADESSAVATATDGGNGQNRRFHLHMWGEANAPARARQLVDRACRTWHLQHLSDIAQLIVSELVTNAIRHAGGDLEVTVALGEFYLHLHVRDRDRHIPRIFATDSHEPAHSRGMKLIDNLASGWGTTLRPYGKSVWATLRIRPQGRVPSP